MDSVSSSLDCDLFGYAKEALQVGRNYVSASSRDRIRKLSDVHCNPASQSAVEQSWGILERFLWCENFTNLTPKHNYLSYTYWPVFDFSLTKHDFWQLEEKTWHVITVLLNDWLTFESTSIRQFNAATYARKNFVPEMVERRVRELEALLAGTSSRSGSLSIHTHEVLPEHHYESEWDFLCSEDEGMFALATLTGLPSSNNHDEYMFLRLVQITECIFNIVGRGIATGAGLYEHRNRRAMTDVFRHLNFYMELLLGVFSLLDTLKVGNFVNGFRDVLRWSRRTHRSLWRGFSAVPIYRLLSVWSAGCRREAH